MARRRKEIALGERVKSRLTDFEGTVSGRAVYLSGCVQVLVTARTLKNGDPNEVWFDETQVVGTLAKPARRPAKETGGPVRTPPPSLR